MRNDERMEGVMDKKDREQIAEMAARLEEVAKSIGARLDGIEERLTTLEERTDALSDSSRRLHRRTIGLGRMAYAAPWG
jgi:archaellum component FlaC